MDPPHFRFIKEITQRVLGSTTRLYLKMFRQINQIMRQDSLFIFLLYSYLVLGLQTSLIETHHKKREGLQYLIVQCETMYCLMKSFYERHGVSERRTFSDFQFTQSILYCGI
jgi:hypothetical protein